MIADKVDIFLLHYEHGSDIGIICQFAQNFCRRTRPVWQIRPTAACMPQIPNQVGPISRTFLIRSMPLWRFKCSFHSLRSRAAMSTRLKIRFWRVTNVRVQKQHSDSLSQHENTSHSNGYSEHVLCVQLVSQPQLNLHVIKHLINVSNPCKQWIIWHCIN